MILHMHPIHCIVNSEQPTGFVNRYTILKELVYRLLILNAFL